MYHYKKSENLIFEAARNALFKENLSVTGYLPLSHSNWTDEQCVRLRHLVIEFVRNYISKWTIKEVYPFTMRMHIYNIQRAIDKLWVYNFRILKGPIFAHEGNILVTIMDSNFRSQQAQEKFRKIKRFSRQWFA